MRTSLIPNGTDKHAAQRRNVLRYIGEHIAELQRNKDMGELTIKLVLQREGGIKEEGDIEYTAKFRFKQAITKEPTGAG